MRSARAKETSRPLVVGCTIKVCWDQLDEGLPANVDVRTANGGVPVSLGIRKRPRRDIQRPTLPLLVRQASGIERAALTLSGASHQPLSGAISQSRTIAPTPITV